MIVYFMITQPQQLTLSDIFTKQKILAFEN